MRQQCWNLQITPSLLFKFSAVNSLKITLITGRPVWSAAMLVLFLLGSPKIGFFPAGATCCPNKREIWHGAPHTYQISCLSRQKCGNTTPQNCQNFKFCPWICPSRVTRLHNFYEILRFYTCLWVAFKFLIWVTFGDKQIFISPERRNYWLGQKKLGGAKMVWTSSITLPSMVGIVGRGPAVDEKVWCFLSVTLLNYKVCDNGNAMKQCYFQNNYGVIACRKVCSCSPIFKFFCGPP